MDRYGNHDWERGDHDDIYVKRLQRDLKKLGFAVVGTIDGQFGRRTFWALREFQIHASWTTTGRIQSGAGHIHERLFPIATGADVYQGPIDGIANADTRKLLVVWLDNDWHCPVVINAWSRNTAGQKTSIRKENVWLHDDHKVSTKHIGYYAHDVSGRFAGVPTDADGAVLIGRYVRKSYYGKEFGGQLSTPPHFVDPASEIIPERLTGKTFAQLSAAGKSSFRVIRAVSEVECIGFFDTLNAYDNAFISVGPCHWTLGIVSPTNSGFQVSKGEMCGTLAYFEHAYPTAAKAVLGDFGVAMSGSWVDGTGNPTGASLFSQSSKKYTSWPAFPDKSGNYQPVPLNEADGNYFKGWHWIYRWIAAGRDSNEYRKAMWDMARVRLRDISSVRVTVNGSASNIGKVFTSEKSIALLLRWHIRYPAYVASGNAGRDVRKIIQYAQSLPVAGGWQSSPQHWTDAHEKRLVEAALEIAKTRSAGFQETIRQVNKWPIWLNGSNPRKFQLNVGTDPLSENRNSFKLDKSGLPPAP